MAKIKDAFVGSTHKRLTVLSVFREVSKGKLQAFANCQCVCGELTTALVGDLGHHTSSCGCLRKETIGAKNKIHGLSSTKTCGIWKAMWNRCTNPILNSYEVYKDRTPPEAWKNYETFLSDMGECPPGLTIERLDNNKPYFKENCVWASRKVQSRNHSRNIWVILEGKRICLVDAAEIESITYNKVRSRLAKSFWTLTQALENPNYSWPEGVNPYAERLAAKAK